MEPIWTLGTMSGTSMDGIDLAMVLTDGKDSITYGPKLTYPYDKEVVAAVREILGQFDDSIYMFRAQQLITQAHINAINLFISDLPNEMQPELIGFHGQTVAHQPPAAGRVGKTLQIGDGQAIANACSTVVAYDFRTADVAAGGQGAPLVPIFQKAATKKLQRPTAIINIGGVANVTYIDDNQLVAFDTGPGCALIDDWIISHKAGTFDVDGRLALQGTIDKQLLAKWLKHPYFLQPPPKALDRDFFKNCLNDCAKLNLMDGAATLTAFTAKTISMSLQRAPLTPYQVLVSGGGRHNQFLLKILRELIKSVYPIEAIGMDGDALEAQAFAYLAVRTIQELPITFPETTGCKSPTFGGQIAHPNVKTIKQYQKADSEHKWINI